MHRLFLFLLLSFVLTTGCKKDKLGEECAGLQDAVLTDNVANAGTAITQFINNLPSQTYSEQNLNKLVAALSGNCSIKAAVLCYSCIQTLPEQTEIRINLNAGLTNYQKTIDISYTPDNRMKFVNMHD
jgi:hypothetical protein